MAGWGWPSSVGRRLAVLVILHALTTAGLLAIAIASLEQVRRDLALMERSVIAPTQALAVAKDSSARLEAASHAWALGREDDSLLTIRSDIENIQRILERYRNEWETAFNPGTDARRLRDEIARLEREDLLTGERIALERLERRVARISGLADRADEDDGATLRREVARESSGLRLDLQELLRVNVGFVSVANMMLDRDRRLMTLAMVVLGFLGIVTATLFGVHVHQTIAPRIQRLVRKVRRFKEAGVNERVQDSSRDEIAVLANALDAGFEAIVARDREREQFLAVAAHELKTPLTAIVGFTQVALENPLDSALHDRALDVIRRQADRVARLIDDVLWAAGARSGRLPFHPEPLDLAVVVRSVVAETQTLNPDRTVGLEASPATAPMLADRELLSHGLWALLRFGMAVSPNSPLRLTLDQGDGTWRLVLRSANAMMTAEDLERAFSPFGSLQYEDAGLRRGLGLFLCREVARLHSGSIRIHEGRQNELTLVMELPR